MTDRRRNLLILLFVGILTISAAVIVVTKPTRLGLDLQGGVQLVYQAGTTPQQPTIDSASIDRTLEVMRDRVDSLGVSEPEIQRSGKDQILVALPAVKNADRAKAIVGKTARLFFYDWEANVLGPNGQPDPSDGTISGDSTSSGVPGGPDAALPQYGAVIRGSRQTRHASSANATGDQWYLVNDKRKTVVAGPEDTQAALYSEDPVVAEQQKKDTRAILVPAGTTIVQATASTVKSGADNGKTPARGDHYYVLRDHVALTGNEIKDPQQGYDQTDNKPNVNFNFTSKGRKQFEAITKTIAQRGQEQSTLGGGTGNQHFAIVLDGQLISVPSIDAAQYPNGIDAINGSEISGGFTLDEAQNLASLIARGALPVNLKLISSQQVSATLGKQALHQSLIAGLAGFAIVAVFLLLFYRALGLLAVTGLAIYALLFYAIIKLVPVTLTLPGIAGLILTVGVAADANIVIFERIKEELRGGKSPKAAIAIGYRRGLSSIIDANVVTFVVAFILFILATAEIKGFAFTLGIGTLVSFFTAVVFTQALLGFIGAAAAVGTTTKYRAHRYDYMGASKKFFSLSGVLLLIGALAIGAKGVNLGIDFKSGSQIQIATVAPKTNQQVVDAMKAAGYDQVEVQKLTDKALGNNAFQITTNQVQPDDVPRVKLVLNQQLQITPAFSSTSIGPTFGKAIANTALIAIIASLLVITAYMALRFEWKYSVPVLIAIAHDILIVAGLYALIGAEVSAATVAALLTILGYSLYDTIIVFDRVRENVPRMPKAAFSQIVNQSMSEVLTRSLATSLCTLLPVTALYFFGGQTLKSFALALIIGTISGAYSSIFIASPVLTHWKEREPLWARRKGALAAANGGTVPAYTDADKLAAAPAFGTGPKGPVRLTRDEAEEVSGEEFAEMVSTLDATHGVDTKAATRAVAQATDPDDPAAARRAEARRRRAERAAKKQEGDN